MLRRLLALSITAAMATVAVAGPQTYASRAQPIRAGIVVLDSSRRSAATPPETSAPFAFYNLDANRTVKPIGWNVSNPHAPGRVTDAIATRYTALSKGPPAVGTAIAKRDAPYWEVFLSSTTAKELADYDILLVNPIGYAALTSTERERLRSFVDHGGLLWIDPSALPSGTAGLDPANSFPTPFMMVNGVASGTDFADYTHPLLKRPFALSARDVDILNTGLPNTTLRGSIDRIRSGRDIPAAISALYSADIDGFAHYRPITYVSNGSTSSLTMAVAQIGDGFVVVTSRGASMKLNRVEKSGLTYDGLTANIGYQALPPVLEADGTAAAKLVVNMVSLLTEFRQQGAGTRKSSGSAITLEAPLLNRTSDTSVIFDTTGNKTYGAVAYKGIIIASAGDHLVAYDPNPLRDLDGDGNPDDGKPDPAGAGMDVLWVSKGTLPSPISMPVVAEVPDSTMGVDQVLVVDASGTMHAFNPVLRTTDGRRLEVDPNRFTPLYSVAPPGGIQPITTGTPNPPAVHEGLAYIADTIAKSGVGNGGRIWVVNLRNGRRMRSDGDWFLGGGTSPFQAQPFAASPTIGYVPIFDNSGGSDKVMYAPMAIEDQSPAGVVSIWLGARGEKPANVSIPDPGAPVLQVETRASQQGGLPIFIRSGNNFAFLNPRITVSDSTGTWSVAKMNATFSGGVSESGGVLTFPLKTTIDLDQVQIRVDYNIDWGNSAFQGVAESIKRGFLQMPEIPGNPRRNITGAVALTDKGTIYLAVAGGSTSALFGFREEGRGSFRCVMRYELYPRFKFNPQGRPQENTPPVVEDHDPVTGFAPILANEFSSLSIVGSPAVRNDQVFIAVNGLKGFVPTSMIMAFRSEPDAARFRVDSVPDGSVLVQPDVARTAFNVNGTVTSSTVVPGANYTWDPDTHILRVDNLMNITRGQVQQCLSLSQRVYLRTPGGADLPIDPDSQGGSNWSPLLWYATHNGYTAQTGPLVTGDTVFMGGNSMVLDFLLNGSISTYRGMLIGMRSQVSPTDDYLTITPGRPWLKQLYSMTGGTANPAFKWPQLSGIADPADFVLRLKQTTLPDSQQTIGIAAGDGTLVALGNHGVYTYNRADILVADEGRLALFDASGNPVWSTNSTAETGEIGTAASVHPLVRPSRAYRLTETDMLVVDAGSSRVFKMNQGGFESRSITSFRLDPNNTPTGFPTNGPLTLNNPRDATTYSNIVYMPEVTNMTLGDGESTTGYEYWDHYLIADSGNRRLIELVDRFAYDPTNQRVLDPIKVNGVPQLGVLFWHSPAAVTGKQYSYNSISRVPVPNGTGLSYVYVAGIGSVLPTSTDVGVAAPSSGSLREASGNGGIVIFDPLRPETPYVVNAVEIPTVPANVLWNETTGSFNSASIPGYTKIFSNVAAVSTSIGLNGANYAVRIMVSDSSGIYEVEYTPGFGVSGSSLPMTWMLPNSVYRTLRFSGGLPAGSNAQGLRATYAHRIDANNVMLVNGYFGKTRAGAPFTGEILQIDGSDIDSARLSLTNFGFGLGSINLKLSPIVGTRGLILPVFADRG